jgi:hypothetical protein
MPVRGSFVEESADPIPKGLSYRTQSPGVEQRSVIPISEELPISRGLSIKCNDRLGGLFKYYHRRAGRDFLAPSGFAFEPGRRLALAESRALGAVQYRAFASVFRNPRGPM